MLSIIIPIKDEEETIPILYERLTRAAHMWKENYEVIIVNDGSTDCSAELLNRIHEKDQRWKIIHFSRNFGHQSAILAGLCYCTGDAAIIMDADLQDPPEELHRFIEQWRKGYQVVYAIRKARKENFLKRASYAIFYRLFRWIATIDIPLDSGDFCLMDRVVVRILCDTQEYSPFLRGIRSWAGFRQIGIEYKRHARAAGTVKYTFSKLLKLAFDGIFSFSTLPLQLTSLAGIFFCFISLVVISFMVFWKIYDFPIFGMAPSQVGGWTSLVSLMLFLSGIQMLFLGVIGEYLCRIFYQVKGRPNWVIASTQGLGQTDKENVKKAA